jgi:Transcriptional regulator, AbiEi antitoxin/Protein of unknown function (DUF559)
VIAHYALITQKAETQYGLISLEQVAKLKIPEGSFRRLVSRGQLVRVAPRVYRICGCPTTWRTEVMAGLLSLGKRSVASHRTAAALHRFEGFDEGPVTFTVPVKNRVSTRFAEIHTTKRFALIDRETVEGVFRCTSASRTIIDLASDSTTASELGQAIDSAIRDGLSSPAYLRKRLARLRGSGVHGVRKLDELLVDSGGHSYLERRFLALIRKAGLPRPTCQVIHRRNGQTFARVDFEFVPLPLVVEVSGRRGHASDSERRRDARRRNELQSEGFVVLEFPTAEVIDHGDRVVETVRHNIDRLKARPTA